MELLVDPLKFHLKSENEEESADGVMEFDHPFSPVTCTRDLGEGETDDIDELTKLMRCNSEENSPDDKKDMIPDRFGSDGESTLMYLEKIWQQKHKPNLEF